MCTQLYFLIKKQVKNPTMMFQYGCECEADKVAAMRNSNVEHALE